MNKIDKNKADPVNDVMFLKNIFKMILTKGNLFNTASNILELISKKVKSPFYVCLLVNENDELVLQSYTNTAFANKILTKLIPFNVFKISYPLKTKDCMITQCVNEKRIVQSLRLRSFFSPVFKPGILLDTIQKMSGIKLCVGIPIQHGENIIGVIAFGSHRAGFSEKELDMLQLYANLSGIAINNNLQFERLEKQYETEKNSTSILSHELKTPIAIAHNSAQTISFYLEKEKANLSPELYLGLTSKIADIHENINRMVRVCNSIFSLREIESNIPTDIHEINLEHQLGTIIETFKQKIEAKKIKFTVNIKATKRKYFGGIIQFEQIMIILLDNALKYTEKGEIQLDISIKGGFLNALVSDTGPGIPASKQEKIFQQYYRHHHNKKKHTVGLGLGLHIAKKIIEKLGGSIIVTPNPKKKGSIFNIQIPVYKSQNLEK